MRTDWAKNNVEIFEDFSMNLMLADKISELNKKLLWKQITVYIVLLYFIAKILYFFFSIIDFQNYPHFIISCIF